MALNSSPVRTDVGYLRRRVKPAPAVATPEPVAHTAPAPAAPAAAAPAPAPAAAAPAPAPEPRRAPSAGLSLAPAAPSAGLSLSPAAPAPGASARSAPAAAAARAVSPASLPFAAPTIDDVRELGADEPVLRLNARESAIGSLIVSGADVAVWEDADRVTGSATAAGDTRGTPVVTSGNRPLVGFDEADAIVSLRHVSRLRRALFIARGPHTLGVQIFDGSTVTVARGDDARSYVLSLLTVNNLVELRAEPVDRAASDDAILAQFGFTLTPQVPTRESRSR